MTKPNPFIILVDDDKASNFLNRRVIQSVLPDARVEIFMDGKQAYDYFRDGGEIPDLLLLDLNMPVWSGWDFLDAAADTLPDFPLVVLSSSVNPEEVARAKAYDRVRDFWSKPLQVAVLQKFVGG